jgi:putative ABC transport system permease protein
VASEQQVLLPAGWLLGLLAVASVAVVAGGRMAEQEKRVGLLKAAGGTPPLAAPSCSPSTWSLPWSQPGPGWPERRAGLIKASTRLPVPLLLGLRLVARRPRRALLSAASFAVTATTIVAVLTFHATLSQTARRAGPFSGPPNPSDSRVSEVLLVVTVAMIILAAANAIFTTWATVLDARRFSAIARSLGATPRQAVAGLSAAQLLPALAGALLGIPAGSAVAGLTAIPARIGARRPIAEILQAELA